MFLRLFPNRRQARGVVLLLLQLSLFPVLVSDFRVQLDWVAENITNATITMRYTSFPRNQEEKTRFFFPEENLNSSGVFLLTSGRSF
jgi:hypothetical protein